MVNESVIVAARRTPIGSFCGQFKALSATELGAEAIRAVIRDAQMDAADIDEVIMGCILTAGLGQAPARFAALQAGVPKSVPCTTVNKMCGSGMQSVILADALIRAGNAEAVVAGGMESMSNAPHLLLQSRQANPRLLGNMQLIDHMLYDGLQDPDSGRLMGEFAEAYASRCGFSREQQDAYAIESVTRSIEATQSGAFDDEIVALTVKGKKAEQLIKQDEQPFKCSIEKIPQMKPVFHTSGTITAANASSISDGAAALLVMGSDSLHRAGFQPLARIVGCSTHAREPAEYPVAPIHAIRKLLAKIAWDIDDVDLFEINEAFAVVAMGAIQALSIPPEKVNLNGGACALGHPVGATGARILVSLVHALRKQSLQRGIAALCIGGGESTAIAIEIGPATQPGAGRKP